MDAFSALNTTRQYGGNATFHFTMQHTPYPAPTVEWFHDGSRIDANTDRVQLSNGSLSLTLINLTLSDEGAYTFMVRNDQGSDSAMFNMDIAGMSSLFLVKGFPCYEVAAMELVHPRECWH